MATKTKNATKKATSKVKNINKELVNASMATINTVVDNGEKWQKLASKLIKKSEKVRAQQINMIFDTAEAVKGQFLTGADKMKDLVGYDATMVEKAKDMAVNHPVSKKVIDIVEDITEKVSENPMVQKAEKVTEDIKSKSMAKFNELKEDVLEQASKIIDKGEAIIEDAKAGPKAKVAKKVTSKKTVARKTTAKKATAKKTVAKKTTKAAPKAKVAKKTTVTKKAAPKKVVAKKATTTKKAVAKAAPKAKTVVAKKVTAVKKAAATKVAEVKTEVKK